jgi:DMSO/TMAO reductase YedYZ molybdopterin-dependent catalytic subunit
MPSSLQLITGAIRSTAQNTEMMGAPLTEYHGAPLRLHMPTKYGYKQIKRIALISYTNTQPDHSWTKLDYDWYAGL